MNNLKKRDGIWKIEIKDLGMNKQYYYNRYIDANTTV